MRFARFPAWSFAAATIVLGGLTSVFIIVAPLRGDAPIDLFGPIPLVVMAAVGALVASRRPRNPMGWLLLGIAFFLVAQAFAQRYARYAYTGHHQLAGAKFAAWFGVWSWMPAFGCLTLVFMLFPTGRALSARWRFIVVGSAALVAAIPFAALPSLINSGRTLLLAPSPAEVPHAHALALIGQGGLQSLLVIGIVTLFVRWFRSRGTERQQMKWFVLGASLLALAVVVVFASSLVLHTDDPTSTPIAGASLLLGFSAISVATGIAVLRYRLYDIDRIISRTVAYVAVTGVLGSLYVLLALVPPSLAGARNVPSWLIALVTLVVAVLFRPVRRRVQDVVDRRFNRARYDQAQTIELFASRLRDDIDLEALRGEIVAVVGRTMQPRHISLWLRS